MEITKFSRNTFFVEAVLVTEDNMKDVAEWCGGEITPTPDNYKRKNLSDQFIKVKVTAAPHVTVLERQTMAFVGDWVVQGVFGPKYTESFKVYNDRAFSGSFTEIDEKPCGWTSETLDGKPCVLGEGHRAMRNPVACRSLRDYLVA